MKIGLRYVPLHPAILGALLLVGTHPGASIPTSAPPLSEPAALRTSGHWAPPHNASWEAALDSALR